MGNAISLKLFDGLVGVEDVRAPAVGGGGPADLLPAVEGLPCVPLLRADGALGDADDAGRARLDHFAVHTGSRFSAKALGPSTASSLWKTCWASSDSSL